MRHQSSAIDRLSGSRCRACTAVHHPPLPTCPECGGPAEAVRLSSRGRVESWTTVHRAPPGFETPYTVAWVKLDEGLRVLSRVEGEVESLAYGSDVELVVDGETGLLCAILEVR